MPVYFANIAKENQRVPDALRKRGLNFLRTAPSQYRANLYPTVRHHYYDVFVSQLHLVASAIWKKRSVTSGAAEYYLGVAPPDFRYLPFEYPPLAVSFTDVGPTLQDWLLSHNFSQETINDVNLWTKHSGLSTDEVRFLATNVTSILTTRTPYMYANLSAVLGMMQIVKYLSVLSVALTHPAIDTEDHFVAYNQMGKRKRGADSNEKDAGSSKGVVEYDGTGYLSGVSPWLGKNADTPEVLRWSVKDGHAAHPAVTNTTVYTSATVVKDTESGFFFPFELDVARTDDEGPINMIVQLFRPNFGRSFGEQTKMANTLKSAWGILKRTAVGDALAHFGKVCELALEGQATVRSIFSESRYEGAAIIGFRLKAMLDGEQRESSSSTVLKSELSIYMSHEIALREIVGLLTGMDTEEVRTPDMDEAFGSIAVIRDWVLKSNDLSVASVSRIKNLALRLRFDNRRMQANYQNICQAIHILTGVTMLDSTWPIDPRCIAETDLVTTVLSGFGRAVPSLVVPDGRAISFLGNMPVQKSRILEARGNKGARQVNTNDFELTIQARLVDIDTAVSDWKWMIQHHSYRIAPLNTAYANHYKVFKGNDRAVLYAALQSMGNKSATASGGSEDASKGKGKSVVETMNERSGAEFDFVSLPYRSRPIDTDIKRYSEEETYTGSDGNCLLEWEYSRRSMMKAFYCSFAPLLSLDWLEGLDRDDLVSEMLTREFMELAFCDEKE